MLTNHPFNITPGEWDSWKNDPITKKVMAGLADEREMWHRDLIEGDTLKAGQEIAMTAKAVGVLYGLDAVLIGVEEILLAQWAQARKGREEETDGGD